MTRIRAQGLSLREDERLPLCLLSIQPQMVGLPYHKSLDPALPLLVILGCRRGLGIICTKFHVEVERLKEELTKRGEELVQKNELLEKTKEDLTNDVANSYMVGFDDAVA